MIFKPGFYCVVASIKQHLYSVLGSGTVGITHAAICHMGI